MRSFQTLRFKLTIIYLLSIVTPFTVLAFVLPYYSQNMITKDTEQLIGGTLHVLSDTIRTYLDDLERLTAAPYMNDNIIQALKIKASRSYETANAYTKLQTDRALTGTLPNYLFNTREDILSTIIMPINSTAYLTSKDNTNRLQDDYPYSEQDWYKKAFLKNGKGAYISAHSQDYLTKQPTRQVFSVARLIKDPDSQQPLAVILSDADLNMFDKITREITFNVSSIVVILDEDKNILYSNNRLAEEIASEINPQGALLQRDFAEFVTVSERIAPADWEIVVFLNKAEIQSKVHWIYKIAVLLSIGGLIVTFFVFLYFSQGIVKPIKQMNEIMSRVKQGQLDSRYETATNDELSYLGHSLNKMIAQLDDLINREYKATLAQRDAEYYALQSQIQPHFLYNTLSGFVGLNRIGEKKKLEDSIISLSGMLRYMLDDNQWTTIEKEFQFLQKYSLLQLNRFADKLTIDIDYEESVAPFKIPKLLIQPILENAVIHGIEPDDKQNEINVTADFIERQGISYVQIIITDNGVGFDPEIQPLETQIGLVNVRARLELAYPNSSFHVTSSIGSGTTVTIIIETGGYHQ